MAVFCVMVNDVGSLLFLSIFVMRYG